MNRGVEVKKVRAYPISGTMKDDRGTYPGQIVRLTLQGLMMEFAETLVQPGDRVEVSFVTPVLNGAVGFSGVVVKVYNQLKAGVSTTSPTVTGSVTGSEAGTVIRLVEIHYKSIPPSSIMHIGQYLETTGQAKK